MRNLIGSIGRPQFEVELMCHLRQVCRAEHLHVFELVDSRPRVVASLSHDGSSFAEGLTKRYLERGMWRSDTPMAQASHCSSLQLLELYVDTDTVEQGRMRDFYHCMGLRSRALVCGRTADGLLGFSVTQSNQRGPFSAEECAALSSVAEMTFCLLAKHREVRERAKGLSTALNCLDKIEGHLAAAPNRLTWREAQVGARLLYGLSTSSIALDLGIGRETVITHVKRLYRRLSIASQRELLLWYLALYDNSGDNGPATSCVTRSPNVMPEHCEFPSTISPESTK